MAIKLNLFNKTNEEKIVNLIERLSKKESKAVSDCQHEILSLIEEEKKLNERLKDIAVSKKALLDEIDTNHQDWLELQVVKDKVSDLL